MAGGGTDKGHLLLTASLWHHYFLSIAAHVFKKNIARHVGHIIISFYVTWGMAGGGTDKGPLLLTASLWHHNFLSIAAHGFIIVVSDMLPFVFTGE